MLCSQTVIQVTRGLSMCKYPSKVGHIITLSKIASRYATLGATVQQVWRTHSNAVGVSLHPDGLPFSNQTSSLKSVAIAF